MADLVRPLGRFLPTDEEGRLLRVGRPDAIPAAWRPAVDACVQAYLAHLPDAVHSVYVRGSVARGEPVEGVSDLDTFAVVHRPRPETGCWLTDEALWPIAEGIAAEHPVTTKVELGLVPLASAMADDCAFTRFALAHTAACVHGEDLGAALPRLRPGSALVFALPHLAGDIAGLPGWRKEGATWAILGPWIGKRILRSALEWGIERHGRYSRDLWPCYSAFAALCPEGAPDMRRILVLTLDAPEDDELWLEAIPAAARWILRP